MPLMSICTLIINEFYFHISRLCQMKIGMTIHTFPFGIFEVPGVVTSLCSTFSSTTAEYSTHETPDWVWTMYNNRLSNLTLVAAASPLLCCSGHVPSGPLGIMTLCDIVTCNRMMPVWHGLKFRWGWIQSCRRVTCARFCPFTPPCPPWRVRGSTVHAAATVEATVQTCSCIWQQFMGQGGACALS